MPDRNVSKRLEDFLDNHLEYQDIGDAENGPLLDSFYVGPQWAIDAADRANGDYMPEWANFFMGEWEVEA